MVGRTFRDLKPLISARFYQLSFNLLFPCINQAMHVLLMHSFCTLHIHILGLSKSDVINSNVHRNDVSLCSGTGGFKTFEFFIKDIQE